MADQLHHELEVADDAATLYLSGALKAQDAPLLQRAFDALPPRVMTLRLDLHGVSDIEAEALTAIRIMLRHWRESRGGSFRLSFATQRIVATYSEGRFADSRTLQRAVPCELIPSGAPRAAAAYLL